MSDDAGRQFLSLLQFTTLAALSFTLDELKPASRARVIWRIESLMAAYRRAGRSDEADSLEVVRDWLDRPHEEL